MRLSKSTVLALRDFWGHHLRKKTLQHWATTCKRRGHWVLPEVDRLIPPKGRIRSPMPVREARRYRDSIVQSGPVILETLRSHMKSGDPVTIVRRRARQLREFTVFGICVCIDESNSMISLTDRNHSYTFLAESVRLREIKRVDVDEYHLRRNALREPTEKAQELGLYEKRLDLHSFSQLPECPRIYLGLY